jgi:hypothetical protein
VAAATLPLRPLRPPLFPLPLEYARNRVGCDGRFIRSHPISSRSPRRGGEMQIIIAADSGGAPAVLGIHPNSMVRLISQLNLPLELRR